MYAGTIQGSYAYGVFGYATHIEDVTGDGNMDLIVGDPAASDGSTYGQAYVFHGPMTGSMRGPTNQTALSDADVRLYTEESFSYLGYGVGTVDESGDGVADVIVAESNLSSERLGSYLGRLIAVDIASGTSEMSVEGFPAIYGNTDYDRLGQDGVMEAGDFDGDGTDELVVGSPGVGFYQEDGGVVSVVALPFVDSARLYDVSTTTIVPGNAQDGCGNSISVGDVDSDGYDDMAFGCPGYGTDGMVGLQLGGASVSTYILASSVTTRVEGSAVLGSEDLGTSVLLADISGDGLLDLIGGAPDYSSASSYEGRVFFLDGINVASGIVDVANADGFVVGSVSGFAAGAGLASVGDLDGDGDEELLLIGTGSNGAGGYGGAFLFTGGEW